MIHVLFCSSAAGTLRQLLDARSLNEKVADLTEDLDFGPIVSDDLADREEWHNLHVPTNFGECDWIAESVTRFRKQISSDEERLIWIAPSSAAEQAGLYWYLAQFGGRGIQMAIADYPLEGNWQGRPPLSLGELGLQPMAELFDGCLRVPWDQSRFSEGRWRALVAEDACLRVVDNGRLRSVPDDYFDPFLLERCPAEWVKWHRVVGDAMGDIWDAGQRADSTLLFWRLRALIEQGRIACDGERPLFGDVGRDAVKVRRIR